MFPDKSMIHIWVLLLNRLQVLYTDFYNSEIDCPTPKRFNSPLTQNQVCIFERILSDTWNFFQSTLSLLDFSKEK